MLPTDLYRNSTQYEKLADTIKKLLDKDCYCSVLVEAIQTGNTENDVVYRIIGDYQHNL
jgi:hypothetical protein